MTTPTIISESPLSLYDVRKELKTIKKRDEALSIRANRVSEYVDMFSPLSDKKAEEIKEAIVKLDVPRLKIDHINKLMDVNPIIVDDVKAVVTGYGLTVKNEHLQKIADLFVDAKK
jgi:DNA-directed RNA polymerase subunit F